MHSNVILILVFAIIVKLNNPVNGDFITTQTGPKPIWNETVVDQLKKDLLVNYDRYARPAQYYNKTEVKIQLTILHVEADESKSTMTLHSYLYLVWTDPKLQWDPSHYNNLHVFRLADHEIWLPDIYLYNSASGGESVSRSGNPQAILNDNGQVMWLPYLKLTSFCQFNLQDWPYDKQQCSLKFGSWTHSGQQLEMSLLHNLTSAELKLVAPNSAWKISNTTAEIVYTSKEKTFGSRYYAQYNITIERVSAPYRAGIISPLYVIVVLILLQFWLPPNTKERLFLSGIIGIVIVIYLLNFSGCNDIGSYNSTRMVSLYSNCLLMTCFAVIMNIIGFTLSTRPHSHSPPWSMTKPLRGLAGKCLLIVQYTGETFVADNFQEGAPQISGIFNAATGAQLIQKGSKFRIQGDWVLLAVAFDRIGFLIYCVIFSALFVA